MRRAALHAGGLAAAVAVCATVAQAATVTLDGAVERQTIRGGGTAFTNDGDPHPIPMRDVAAQLHALGFRVVRQCSTVFMKWLESANDDDDPFHYNWDSGPNSLNRQLAAADAAFRLSRTFQDAGLEVCPGTWWVPRWMMRKRGRLWEFDPTIPGVYDEVAEYWTAFLLYARNKHGVRYPYLSLTNEPDPVNTSTTWKPAAMRDAIRKLGARLKAKGLATRVVTPNCCMAARSQSYLRTILADPIATRHLAAAAYHAYDSPSLDVLAARMRRFANDPRIRASRLPIWMTEWVLQYDKRNEAYVATLRHALDWAKFIHHCYADGQCSVVIASPGVGMEYARDSGMYGLGLAAGGLRLRKFAHAMTQYHRFIQPASRRIDAKAPGARGLFVTAFKHPRSGALAIVVLNTSESPVRATVGLTNLSPPASMRAVRTSATEDSAELGRTRISGASFTVELPKQSVTTYVGSTRADASPPSVPTAIRATALSDTQVRLTWNASTDNVAVAEYKVLRNGAPIGTTAGTSYLDHGLAGSTGYAYAVLAFDLAGNESAHSKPARATTRRDTTPPAVPAHLVATPRPNAVTLTWDPRTDSVSDHDLRGFRVYRASAPSGPYRLLARLSDRAATGYTDTFAANGRTCYYVVAAYDDENPPNQSAHSNKASATPNPRRPGGLAAHYYDSKYVRQGRTSMWDWFHALKTSRIDATVDFHWEKAGPPAGRYVKGLFGRTKHWCMFGVRWHGEVRLDRSQTHTFETRSLDGARLWVDGKLVIDDWGEWFTRTNRGSLALAAGWHAIRLDYHRYHPEAHEAGVVRLSYSSPSLPKRIIPADHLATARPAN